MGDRVATQQLMVVPRHRLSTVDAEHSLCTAPWSGTSCRTTSAHSRTMSPLDRVWKPGFSPDTSLFSTLETFEVIALYKSTFTIPFAIPYHCVFHFPNENEMENNTRFSSVQFSSGRLSSNELSSYTSIILITTELYFRRRLDLYRRFTNVKNLFNELSSAVRARGVNATLQCTDEEV